MSYLNRDKLDLLFKIFSYTLSVLVFLGILYLLSSHVIIAIILAIVVSAISIEFFYNFFLWLYEYRNKR